jgi:protein-tyrosine phosphatase
LATEIRPRLFLGDLGDAIGWEGPAVTVLEDRSPDLPSSVVHIPIYDPEDGRARYDQMEKVVAWVSEALRSGDRQVLVSCGQGIERSPLVMAWYLHRVEGVSLGAAYEAICGMRPQVQPRLEWLHGPGFPVWW